MQHTKASTVVQQQHYWGSKYLHWRPASRQAPSALVSPKLPAPELQAGKTRVGAAK
jgi:hypothetical protein